MQAMAVAVLVNVRARRGSEAIGELVRSVLPHARLAVTTSLEEARRWVVEELMPNPPQLLLSGGGDGTAVSLLNELRDANTSVPALGLLPLGTGNGWARVTGAPRARTALRGIAALDGSAPPLRHFGLVETEGRLTPFAGTGWDAEIVSDYQGVLASLPSSLNQAQSPTLGYLRAIFTRTIPRHLSQRGPATVTLTNLGEHAYRVDDEGKPVRVADGARGAVLYHGPLGVAGAGTTTDLGLGFRAFPFAHAMPGRLAVRVYGATPIEAMLSMPKLWRGAHPVPKSHSFLLTHCRMDFDREVPFEIGGDLLGDRRSVEFRLAAQGVNLVDWASLRARPGFTRL